MLTIVVASLALMLALAGGPAAAAATKRLPIQPGRTARPGRRAPPSTSTPGGTR